MAGADPELLAKTVADLAEEAQMLAPGADGVDDQAMVAGGVDELRCGLRSALMMAVAGDSRTSVKSLSLAEA